MALFIEKAARLIVINPAVTALNAFLVLLVALIEILTSLFAILHFQISCPQNDFIRG